MLCITFSHNKKKIIFFFSLCSSRKRCLQYVCASGFVIIIYTSSIMFSRLHQIHWKRFSLSQQNNTAGYIY